MSCHSKKIALLILSILLLSVLAGCRRPPRFPGPPIIVPGDRHHERPRIRHYRYRYFPGSQVYYDRSRHVYFYFHNNVWRKGSALPRHIHIDIDNYVILELEGLKPHLHHKKTIKHYPPKAFKKKRQKQKMNKKKGRLDKREKELERREKKVDRKEEKYEKRKEHRKEYRDEKEDRRYDKGDRRRDYRDEDYDRRDDKRDRRRDYRDEDDERRDDKRGRRGEYRDEDEDRNNRKGKRGNGRDDWRGGW